MTSKGYGVKRGRYYLLYGPKGHSDLCRFDLVMTPKGHGSKAVNVTYFMTPKVTLTFVVGLT